MTTRLHPLLQAIRPPRPCAVRRKYQMSRTIWQSTDCSIHSGYTYDPQNIKVLNDLAGNHPCFTVIAATMSYPVLSRNSMATLISGDILAASSVAVKWQQTDTTIVDQLSTLGVLGDISSMIAHGSGTNTATSKGGASAIGTGTAVPSASASKESNNLAVKVAVPIAIVVAAILAVLAFCLFRKHKRSKRAQHAYGQDASGMESPGLEYPISPAMAARATAPSAIPAPPRQSYQHQDTYSQQDQYPAQPDAFAAQRQSHSQQRTSKSSQHAIQRESYSRQTAPPLLTDMPRKAVAEEEATEVSPISSHRPSFEDVPARTHTPPLVGAGGEPISPVESTHSHSRSLK